MQPTTVRQPDIGLFVGDWDVTLRLEPPLREGSMGTIRAYATSPRDGSVDFETSIRVAFESR